MRGEERRGAGFAVALLLLLAAPAFAQSGDAARGRQVFEERCAMCHGEDGDGQAPNLHGVMGRKAGSAAAYPYTTALLSSGITWTQASLDKFLADPGADVPGTAMRAKVEDAAERRDLIAYLASLKP
jgi:cytochrome c